MKKMIAAAGIPFNEGCPMNTEFPDTPVTSVATPKLLWVVGEGDPSVEVTFDETYEKEGKQEQILRFSRGGICYAEVKVWVICDIGKAPRIEALPLIDAMKLADMLLGACCYRPL